MYVIPINPYNDISKMVHDQQLVVTMNFDSTDRVANSTLWNESNKSTENLFSLLTFAVVNQVLVDASYVKNL